MQRFTQLYLDLDRTTRTSDKQAALVSYFRDAAPADAAWAAYVLSGRKFTRAISSRLLRELAAEVSGNPQWIIDESYSLVGDLSETLSLIIPPAADPNPPPLHEMIEKILRPMASASREDQKKLMIQAWETLTIEQRLVFHKLLSTAFRVGASKQLLLRALAEVAGVETAIIAHRFAGVWKPDAAAFEKLICADGNGSADGCRDPALPYPFMLAHPIEKELDSLGSIDQWHLEWKWDGIRSQVIRRQGKSVIWSRGDEVVSGTFPEITQAASMIPDGTVLDGEIVAWENDRPMSFAALQPRLNRKVVEPTFWPAVPVTFIAFDLLEWEGRDLRAEPLSMRRALLKELFQSIKLYPEMRLSSPVLVNSWSAAQEILAESRDRGVEGLMLKELSSHYLTGRPRGSWWKLKVQPYTIDAVLIAAEPGSGIRAGLYTAYSFGLWDETRTSLVTVARAYSGLTDEEIIQVDRFVRNNTLEKYGPVRTVKPELVFELGFEAIQRSDRHKSGIAVRFPRMLRWRTDKKPADADTLETLWALLTASEARR